MEKIVVLDFGGQYTQNIARRVREAGVYCEIMPYNTGVEKLLSSEIKGIILSGSPQSVHAAGAYLPDERIFNLGKPILGICYGHQLIGHMLGGKVVNAQSREYGKAQLEVLVEDSLFDGLLQSCSVVDAAPTLDVWMSHGDKITSLPPNFVPIGRTENSEFASVKKDNIYGVQFHPEVDNTPKGREILKNFAYNVCGCKGGWTMQNYIEFAKDYIRKTIGKSDSLILVSGGVDSTVAAALLAKTEGIGHVYALHIDNGLMRKGESEQVVKTLRGLGIDVIFVDASKEFLKALVGVSDPEQKRHIIGDMFIKIQEREVARLGLDISKTYLVQGTLYTDLIESGMGVGAFAKPIKSHHNVASPLVAEKRKQGMIVEPNQWIFKDEVRKVGEELGLPKEITGRQPFPGPGLAIRIKGEITEERLEVLREVDDIYLSEIRAAGLYDDIWQAFAVLLPDVKSVGVMGDERTYESMVALRAVTSKDGMTADWFDFPRSVLKKISDRIVNEMKGINRVVYDISSKPPSTIEWE